MFKKLLAFYMLVISLVLAWGVFYIVGKINDQRPAVETHKSDAHAIKAVGECLQCHQKQTPAITKQYLEGKHHAAGVSCLDCHKAYDDASEHTLYHNGFKIVKDVTAGACAKCHIDEYKEFERSRHALPSWTAVVGKDAFTEEQLAEAAKYHPGAPVERGPNKLAQMEGKSAINSGCATCHEIGAPNPDGSIGDCTKCHGRHEFSVEMSRHPMTCGSCHMGPDHSQLEIWTESKHGVQFHIRRDKQDLTVSPKELGVIHQDTPTCSTCHMSGLEGLGMTHDVGERLSYFLFAPISQKRPHADLGAQNMKDVCLKCHTTNHVENFYAAAEQVVIDTNAKVQKVVDLEKELRAEGLLTPEPFDEPIEFAIFDYWHYWGRTAKHGAYMGGADYVQWHGNYELTKEWVEIEEMAAELREKAGHDRKKQVEIYLTDEK